MKKEYLLDNGLRVIVVKKPSETVAVEVNVKVGSNYEVKDNYGISHFIEHMLFDGTKKRKTSLEISNEIEKYGAEFNAATSNERTLFYVKINKRKADVAFDILSDMIKQPLFRKEDIEKERKIILDELRMYVDQPRYFQWELFSKALFKQHPARHPIIGYEKTIKSITREQIVEHYNRFYAPSNIVVAIVGDVKVDKKRLEKYFLWGKKARQKKQKLWKEKPIKKPRIIKDIRKTQQSYVVFGYNAVTRDKKDSYVLDVIRAILGRGQSGRLFDVIRTKHGLVYDIGVYLSMEKTFGFFSIYFNTNKKNIGKIKELIFEQFEWLKGISEKELKDAKSFLEGEFYIQNEDNQKLADSLAFFEGIGNYKMIDDYIKNIKKVTKQDIIKAVKKYFGKKNYAMAVIE